MKTIELANTTEDSNSGKEQFAFDVLSGLSSTPKSLPAKYFYDDRGSELFVEITRHDDYYLTRTEFDILKENQNTLPKYFLDEEIDIIELGAGDGHKSQLILEGFLESQKRVNYYPIDISAEAMKQLEKRITPHQNLLIEGIVAEYLTGLKYLRQKSTNRQLVLFLGSNIGNFDLDSIKTFLRRLWHNLGDHDFLLTGFDLKKDMDILNKAYNDSSGHTEAFNHNLLTRINRELGANFKLPQFKHYGVYNPLLGAMESFMVSLKTQSVYIEKLKREFHFEAFEPLHLENSFKFTKKEIEILATQTGFSIENHFVDQNQYFIDSLWQVVKR